MSSTSPRGGLSRREREILHVLFAFGRPASAEEIRERLVDPPGSSAIRTMLTRLEAKGHLRHREDGLRYVYLPTTPAAAARSAALADYVRVFFDGSIGKMANELVRSEEWSDDDLDALRAEIDRVRKQRRRS
jgi:predicted transcriptional regulator